MSASPAFTPAASETGDPFLLTPWPAHDLAQRQGGDVA